LIHYIEAVVRGCSRAFASVRICFVPFAPLVPQAGEMNNVNRRCMPHNQVARCVLETRLTGPVAWTEWVVAWEDGSIGAGILPPKGPAIVMMTGPLCAAAELVGDAF
jgi:hypothetical protein